MGPSGLDLDVGPFTAALEFASGRPALVLGKPAAQVFTMAAARLGLAPGEVLMVGDDVVGDVQGALAAGLAGVLVRTGKYRAGDEQLTPRPSAVLGSVVELPQLLGC
jgi:ribonucleotide monophosphatase NagD (HAD superfamily)